MRHPGVTPGAPKRLRRARPSVGGGGHIGARTRQMNLSSRSAASPRRYRRAAMTIEVLQGHLSRPPARDFVALMGPSGQQYTLRNLNGVADHPRWGGGHHHDRRRLFRPSPAATCHAGARASVGFFFHSTTSSRALGQRKRGICVGCVLPPDAPVLRHAEIRSRSSPSRAFQSHAQGACLRRSRASPSRAASRLLSYVSSYATSPAIWIVHAQRSCCCSNAQRGHAIDHS